MSLLGKESFKSLPLSNEIKLLGIQTFVLRTLVESVAALAHTHKKKQKKQKTYTHQKKPTNTPKNPNKPRQNLQYYFIHFLPWMQFCAEVHQSNLLTV